MNNQLKTSVRATILLLVVTVMAACAAPQPGPTELIVLLADAKGKVGTVIVNNGSNKTVLNSALAAARVGDGKTQTEAVTLNQDDVDKTFAAALQAVPPEPVSFTLYFAKGSTELLAKSQPAMRMLLLEVASRQVAEVQVTGHTDTVGRLKTNDKLALERARAVAEVLQKKDLGTKRVLTAGRGERDLLVPTADNIAEPLNRRVEIIVR
jgi:outer membrane protein OmpA-like peptidoglycan-associated protein